MKLTCVLAQGDKFGRIVCTVNSGLPCTFQRYCALDNEWQNTNDISKCERRKDSMAKPKKEKNKTEILSIKIDEKNEEIFEKNTKIPQKIEKNDEKIEKNEQKNSAENNKRGTVQKIIRTGYIIAPLDKPENLCL